MSFVTNIILHMSTIEEEDERIKEVNAYFSPENNYGISDRPLIGLDDTELLPRGWYGGTKYLECELYVGAYNYLNLEAFLKHLSTAVKWSEPQNVQVFVKEQNYDKFKVVYGVQEFDSRFVDRDMLLSDAEFAMEQIVQAGSSNEGIIDSNAVEWLAAYKKFKEANEE